MGSHDDTTAGQPLGAAAESGTPTETGGFAPPPPADRKRRGGATAIVLASALVLGLVGGLLGGFLGNKLGGASSSDTAALPVPPSDPGTTVGTGTQSVCDATAVAATVLPAIVTINVVTEAGGGVGSGSIIDSDGHILTNNHVISAAATGGSIFVTLSNGQSVPAELVGRDPKADVAVVKIAASDDLPTIAVGNSDGLVVGQPVVALGAPLGLSSTVTTGIVSALGRNVPVPSEDDSSALLAGAVQTDAAINPGNSGGALVDCTGAQIGMNTAIATVPTSSGEAGGGSVGIGFAVPMNLAMSLVDQIIETGSVSYPFFGVSVVAISAAAAEKFGTEPGLFVDSVVPAGPAATAGLQPGDIITSLNGQPALTLTVLTQIQLTNRVGDTVTVGYLRGGETGTLDVTLGTAP